jgi:hypothetical protein
VIKRGVDDAENCKNMLSFARCADLCKYVKIHTRKKFNFPILFIYLFIYGSKSVT